MLPASFALAGLAIALAWPVPVLLDRAVWPSRAPGSALLVWQSVALAGGLSMIGAMLLFGLAPFGDTLIGALFAFVTDLFNDSLPPDTGFLHLFAVSGAVLLCAHLFLSLLMTWTRARRHRQRHRALVEMLSQADPEHPRTRMLETSAPLAYCLPGTARSVTVLSAGLVALLDKPELDAVIAHERGHALQRHHLVLVSFRAWHRALPWFPVATRAERAVATLVELLADDHARRTTRDEVLRRSIMRVATAADGEGEARRKDPTGWTATGVGMARLRAGRLDAGSVRLGLGRRVLVVACAAGLLCVPTAMVVTPSLV